MPAQSYGRLRFILGFALFFTALWFLWDTPLVYPLKIFVVLLHEVSHAVVAVVTGGTIERIILDPREGGACYCPGGNTFLTLSAGYLGSPCDWCCGAVCPGSTPRTCEPHTWLLARGDYTGYSRNGAGYDGCTPMPSNPPTFAPSLSPSPLPSPSATGS